MGVCMLWAGGQLAQPFSGFCVVERTAAVLGLCGQSAGWFSALGFQPIPRRDGPVCRYKLPQPYRDRYEFPLWRVYPGTDGPWPGMRMEAARRGAEDAALLALLRCRDEAAHDALVARVFHDNQNYNDDPAVFETVYEELLHLLEEGGKA